MRRTEPGEQRLDAVAAIADAAGFRKEAVRQVGMAQQQAAPSVDDQTAQNIAIRGRYFAGQEWGKPRQLVRKICKIKALAFTDDSVSHPVRGLSYLAGERKKIRCIRGRTDT